MTAVADQQGVSGTAVRLRLDLAGEEAFTRLAKSLPGLATEHRDAATAFESLAADLVVVPTVEKATTSTTLDQTVTDLDVVVAQILDDPTKARIETATTALKTHQDTRVAARKLAVPQVGGDLSTEDLDEAGVLAATQGKTFLVVPIDEAKFAVVGPDGNQRSTHKDQATAATVAAKLNETLEKGIQFRILKKAETEERTVFGVVLEPETVDLQDDIYSAAEIRKSAFRFMEEFQQIGIMHKKIVSTVKVLESYLSPVDFTVNGQAVKKGTWLIRVRVLDDAIWKKVKTGKLTGFSIGGSAVRTPETIQVAA